MKLWTRIKVWIGLACPKCGARLIDVNGWPKSTCEGCGKTYNWY